jgi:MoaA/NifB/PqqE/SkfB family radical SAM enzyme
MNNSEANIGTMPIVIQRENVEYASMDFQETVIKQKMVVGLKKTIVQISYRLTIVGIAIKNYRNPWHWIAVPIELIKKRRRNIGQYRLQKFANVAGRYYWGLYTPGWNGVSFKNFIASEMDRIIPMGQKTNRFVNTYVAITKKCSLQCEHCYEWENLNKKDVLSYEQLSKIISTLQDQGVSIIHLTGGEPLLKIELITQLLKEAKKDTDFWVLTSGLKLTDENAKLLKTSGLNGVMISLDHYIPEKHNEFRGFKDAYYWVENGVKNAISNDLVAALSICVTKDFVSRENLMQYAKLAKEMGVSFVQILEPRAVGHYKDTDVNLSAEQFSVLDAFYLQMNYDAEYKDFPLISYHGYHQRRQGCYGAGNRSLYVDTDGDMNACPFCQKKTGNILDDSFSDSLKNLQSSGCHKFKQGLD